VTVRQMLWRYRDRAQKHIRNGQIGNATLDASCEKGVQADLGQPSCRAAGRGPHLGRRRFPSTFPNIGRHTTVLISWPGE